MRRLDDENCGPLGCEPSGDTAAQLALLDERRQSRLIRATRDNESDEAEFVGDGTLTTTWGGTQRTRQAYELRIDETDTPYNKKFSGAFDDFVAGKRNQYAKFEREAHRRLDIRRRRVFVVMPIQGDEYGGQSERSIYLEFTARFAVIETVLEEFDCIAIRIDREAPMGSLVERIKREIARSEFLIADLTDERPSCYYESGYGEALGRPVIFVASRESVLHPGEPTRVHFDIHQNVQFFGNHDELAKKLGEVIARNRERLLPPPVPPQDALSTWSVLNTTGSILSVPTTSYRIIPGEK
jgi:hypothetical protein